MAIIPRSERSIAIDSRGHYTRPADFGGEAIGKAVSGLGDALSGLAAQAQQERNDLDMFQTKMEMTKFYDEQVQKQVDYDAGITGDGRDHTANRLVQYDTDAAAVAQRLPNNRKAQQYAALHLQDWRGNFGNRSYATQQKQLGNYYADETTKLINETIIPNLPKDINGIRQALGSIDQLINSAPAALPYAVREGVRQQAAQQVFKAWLSIAGPEAAAQAEDLLKEYQMKHLGKPKGDLPGAFGEPPLPKQQGSGRIDDSGIEFIKRLEGSKDNGWDYRQYSGPYGVKRGRNERLTLEQADTRLREEVAQVEKDMAEKIKKPLSQGQHNALVSFFYNLGTGKGRLDRVADMINSGRADEVPAYMAQFTRNSDGGYMSGLEKRRQEEIALFKSQSGPTRVADASGQTVGPPAPRSVADYFTDHVIENLPKIRGYAIQAERKAETEQNKAMRAAEAETERQGLEKLYDRSLTREWIEQNAGNMTNRVYSRLMNAVTPRARTTDPATYTDLLERADEKPADVIREASDAYANGLLNQEAFERIYAKARRAAREDTRLPPWATEQRQVLKRALKPDKSATEEEIKAYQAALEGFDNYTHEQQGAKTLDRKLLTEYTQKAIEEFKTERLTAGRKALPMPRFSTVGREAMTPDEIDAASKKAVDALKAGKISMDEAKTEAQVLKRWRDALEKEATAKGEKLAPSKPSSTPKPSAPKPEKKAPF